jgi:iturin family lipopeptide synthetase B
MSVISLLSKLKESEIRVRFVDDKLKLNVPKGRLSPDLLNELKLRREQVIEFLRSTLKEDDYTPIEPVEKKEYYKLSSAQKRLYFIHQLLPESTAYNMPMNVLFPSDFAVEGIKARLEFVFKQLISRHESFRTSFELVNGQPMQRIHDEVEFEIEYSNLEQRAESIERKEIGLNVPGSMPYASFLNNFPRPFDLSNAPLLWARLINTGETYYLLLIDMHHIISDGTSHDILRNEFLKLLYHEKLVNLKLQYKDYSEWQSSGPQRKWILKQEPYWLKEFSDELPVLHLPIDYPRPLIQGFAGAFVQFELDSRETSILKDIAEENDVTLYMILLVVFNVLFSKLSGQEDIIVGSPIAARPHHDLQYVIGMLVNTLAMRNYPSGGKTVREFLKEVKQRSLKAYENQGYPFEELVEKISVNRDTSRNPIFDVMLNLLNQSDYHYDLQVMRGKAKKELVSQHHQGFSRFDMTIYVIELEERIHLNIEYSTTLFKPATIEGFLRYIKKIVSQLAGNMDQKLANIEIIAPEEKKAILEMSRGVKEIYDMGKTIHQLFAEQAARSGDSTALVCIKQDVEAQGAMPLPVNHIYLTYNELNQKANQLAHLLREKGVGPDTIVGLMVDRSIEMIIGIVGILKAGGAYLPIDPDYPPARQKYMLADSKAKVLLKKSEIAQRPISKFETNPNDRNSNVRNITNGPVVLNFEHLDFKFVWSLRDFGFCASNSNSSNLIYLIYTSGTSGKPKGVMLEHRNLVNLIQYQFNFTNIDFSRVLQFTTISFDVSAQEIFSTLLAGGTLVLVNKETIRDISQLLKVVDREKIKTTFWPASFLKYVMNEEIYVRLIPDSLEHIVTAGEQVIINERFNRYLQGSGVYFYNHYGPSETHVVTAWNWGLGKGEELPELPPIGKPISNTNIYILDRGKNLVPVGVAGELVIGGIQVGRGYLNRPELTAEKFDHDLWDFQDYQDEKKKRRGDKNSVSSVAKNIYKTADLCRWLADGNIEFLGRIDQQVKIRGFRVELGEIEIRLLNHDCIKEGVVLTRKDDRGFQYLYAYITARAGKKISSSGLREYLAKDFPAYMIPAYFIQLEKIPLTANGKVDRRMLPLPQETDIHLESTYTAPKTGLQRTIAEIWKEVLGREKVGTRDNFFDLGGNSLDVITVSNKLKETLKKEIAVVTIFTYPTIGSLENYLKSKSDNGSEFFGREGLEHSELIDEGKDLLQKTLKKIDKED